MELLLQRGIVHRNTKNSAMGRRCRLVGKGTLPDICLTKLQSDLEAAFRHPVRRRDWPLLAFFFDGVRFPSPERSGNNGGTTPPDATTRTEGEDWRLSEQRDRDALERVTNAARDAEVGGRRGRGAEHE